jgi:hypothetical protein
MFEYAVTLRTKSGATYNISAKRTYDNVPRMHDTMKELINTRDFLWTVEEFMVRTSEVEAFHVHRLPTLQEKHDEAEEYILAYLKMYHPYESFTIDDLVNIYKYKPTGELNREIPICNAVLSLQSFLQPISEYQEEQNK